MQVITIVAALTLVAGATGATIWHATTSSPSYALKQIAVALQQRDRYAFEKYVDVDSVLQSIAAGATEGNVLASAIGDAVLSHIRPQITEAIEEGLMFKNPQVSTAMEKATASAAPQIERIGHNAWFVVPIATKGGAPFSLRIHMAQAQEGHWRIDRVANVAELRKIEEEEEKERKTAIAKANDEKLSTLRILAKLHTSVRDGWDRKNRFQVRFENTNDKPITSFTGQIRVTGAGFKQGIKGTLKLAPGKTDNGVWEFDVNRFIADTERVFALGESDQFDIDVDSISFADGSHVARGDTP